MAGKEWLSLTGFLKKIKKSFLGSKRNPLYKTEPENMELVRKKEMDTKEPLSDDLYDEK